MYVCVDSCMLVDGCHIHVYGCMCISALSLFSIFIILNMASSLETPSPGPQDSPAPLTSSGTKLDLSSESKEKIGNVKNLRIVHVEDIPLQCNYEDISTSLIKFGNILDIRMSFMDNIAKWEAWVTFSTQDDAFKASCSLGNIKICGSVVKGALTDKTPRHLDIYRPGEWNKTNPVKDNVRTPQPPMWLVVKAKEDNFNYYKFSKYIQQKVGGIKSGEITRFGKNSVLIHAKSKTQSQMLSMMNIDNDEVVEKISPHLNVSYGRGVVFDRDLYDFTEGEILDMCPQSVWKVKKVPNGYMMIFHFGDSNVPSHIIIENERIRVRPYHHKALQCFNCYKYGHPSKVCKNSKLCNNCSDPEHDPEQGQCTAAPKCANCQLNHKSVDKVCEEFKFETAAVNKAYAEHISIGHAKRLLGRHNSYSRVLATTRESPKPVVPSLGKDPTAQVVAAQHSGPSAQPDKARAQSNRPDSLPPVVDARGPSAQPDKARAQSNRPDSLPPVVDTSRSAPGNENHSHHRPSTSSRGMSQAESLPDLMEYDEKRQRKRGRTPSSSPPSTPNKHVSLQNRFDVLNKSDSAFHVKNKAAKVKYESSKQNKDKSLPVKKLPKTPLNRGLSSKN